MNDTENKHLILGQINGFDIKPFILSLRKSGYKGDVCFFVSEKNIQKHNYLRQYGVKLVKSKDEYPFITDISDVNNILPKLPYNKMAHVCSRFVMYYLYLSKYGKNYSKVMLTDVRDVIFQHNPFDFKFNKGLCCFLEDKRVKINTSEINTKWIREGFGEKVLAEIGHNCISCAGITIGETSKIMNYLKKMVDYLTQGGGTSINDQGVHNYLIYTNQLNDLELFENEKGPVLTLGQTKKGTIHFNNEGLIINDNGDVFNVIHQYEAHIELFKQFYKKFKLNYRINSIKIRLKNLLRKLDFLRKLFPPQIKKFVKRRFLE
ncbi:MAG: hypothetical protein HWN67_23525 [Candidatus Helarchaeota archaeon]|nr:hypothetical protein [Candidatus Helarchaeota archaeon]